MNVFYVSHVFLSLEREKTNTHTFCESLEKVYFLCTYLCSLLLFK